MRSEAIIMRYGVDTGGTFTDVVAEDGTTAKVLSTPADPSIAVASGIETAGGDADVLAHGTTVATNAVLERRGGRVALITNAGLRDAIEIGRQNRPSLYDPFADRPEPLVPRDLRFEVTGRLDESGNEIEPLGPVPDLPAGIDSVAVCLLHADLNPSHEEQVGSELRSRGTDVTCSHEISPEFREYERTVTTVVNSYVRPVTRRYLERLGHLAGNVLVMTSAGGLLRVDEAAERSAALLLSGPAGGVRAAAAAAEAAGFPNAVTFDMGGTSTDVCLVLDGRPAPAAVRSVAGFAVRMPSLDIHTIGAGGGSIARLDRGGALQVGPESAGADPGPVCYRRGGTEPTVTDADLVAGRIPADATFPGLPDLDVSGARAALGRIGATAEGVIAVVDAAMVQAVRRVSVEQGVDPRGLALVAFGGAGPLHACAIAEALDMAAVVVPPRAGVLSAVGLVCAPEQEDRVRSWPTPTDHDGIADVLRTLGDEARDALGSTGEVTTAVDCRYEGQSHELRVPDVSAFEEAHRRMNGFDRPGHPVEVVALRATATISSPVSVTDLPLVETRKPAAGPNVLAEPDCTVWLSAGWTAEVGGGGSWILRRSKS